MAREDPEAGGRVDSFVEMDEPRRPMDQRRRSPPIDGQGDHDQDLPRAARVRVAAGLASWRTDSNRRRAGEQMSGPRGCDRSRRRCFT